MKRQYLILYFQILFFYAFAQKAAHIEGQILVNIEERQSIEDILRPLNDGNRNSIFTKIETLDQDLGYYCLSFDSSQFEENKLLAEVNKLRGIISAQFNHKVEPRKTPNDALFGNQWDMRKIQAESVWETTTGGTTANGDTIVVAVVEVAGFNQNHPDIIDNIYRNRFEIPNDGKDNDNNGYIDDIYGWNCLTDNGKTSDDTGNHGTPVLSIIGARGNNTTGVTGVNWNIKMMLFSNVDDEKTSIKAYAYILKARDLYNKTKGKQGAFVVALNYSAGIDNAVPSQTPLWCKMFDELGKVGVLAVVATSNTTQKDIEISGDIPTQCPSNHLIGVTNTDKTDKILGACGTVSVDLSAPGGFNSGSTGTGSFVARPTGFGEFSGTSAATPHVAGTIALLYSFPNTQFASAALERPSETAIFIKDAILKNVDKVSSLETCVATGGRLNAFSSFKFLQKAIEGTEIRKINLSPNPATEKITLKIETNGGAAPKDIFIYNSIGQLVLQPEVKTAIFESSYTLEINVRNLALGIYFLAFKDTEGKFQTQRFLVR